MFGVRAGGRFTVDDPSLDGPAKQGVGQFLSLLRLRDDENFILTAKCLLGYSPVLDRPHLIKPVEIIRGLERATDR